MASKKILFVHLSDIHIGNERDEILKRTQTIAATAFQHLPEVNNVVVVVSGDIAWSGKAAEYELARVFLNSIREIIQRESLIQ